MLAVVEHEQERPARRGSRRAPRRRPCPGKRAHVERGGHGVSDERRDRTRARARRAPRRPRTTRCTARASSSARRVLPAPPVPASVSSRPRPSSAVSSRELAVAADERARRRPGGRSASRPRPRAARAPRESRRERLELVAPRLGEVVVAVLGQELAAVERERRAIGGARCPARRAAAAASSKPSTSTSAASTSSPSRASIASAPSARRATCTAWLRLFAAAAGSSSRPERVHRLLAVQPVPVREREQLDQLARLLQPPGAVRHVDAVDRGAEAAEQPDLDLPHAAEDARGHPPRQPS